MIYLNDLQFIPGSMKKRKRVARGNSGKSAGKGFKGQKARSGVSLSNFQGGQTPIERRIPKHNSVFVKKSVTDLPLSRLLPLLNSKVLAEKAVLTRDLLEQFSLVKKKTKYKVIGFIDRSITIEADCFSKGAQDSIESNGGKVTVLQRNTR